MVNRRQRLGEAGREKIAKGSYCGFHRNSRQVSRQSSSGMAGVNHVRSSSQRAMFCLSLAWGDKGSWQVDQRVTVSRRGGLLC